MWRRGSESHPLRDPGSMTDILTSETQEQRVLPVTPRSQGLFKNSSLHREIWQKDQQITRTSDFGRTGQVLLQGQQLLGRTTSWNSKGLAASGEN